MIKMVGAVKRDQKIKIVVISDDNINGSGKW